MQSGVAEQVAAVSPSVAEQLPEAIQTGGSIAIPIEEALTRIAPTEYAQGLIEHVRVEPEGFTRAEAREYRQSDAARELQADMERAIAEKEGDDVFKASQGAVKQAILDELNTLGRFRRDRNEGYASQIRASERSVVRPFLRGDISAR
jgi:hypothetical protein